MTDEKDKVHCMTKEQATKIVAYQIITVEGRSH